MENIFACYRNIEGNWVIDGDRGRDTYPPNWEKKMVMNAYSNHPDGFHVSLGKYEISVYQHDIRYKDGDAALVTIDQFSGNNPLGRKAFYLPAGKYWNQWATEKDVDKIFVKREGSWI